MKIVAASLLFLITVGCQKDLVSPVIEGDTGNKVDVELSFKLQAPATPENSVKTKSVNECFMAEFGSMSDSIATKATSDITLYNLYVFQFNADGTPTQKPILIDQVASSLADNVVQLPVTLTVGENQTLYLVALGKALTDDLMKITSLAALKRYPFRYIDVIDGVNTSKIKSEDDVPFTGKADGVTIIQFGEENKGLIKYNVPEGFTGGVVMERLVSKVALNYAFEVTDYSAYGVRLKSVPSQFRVEPSPGDNITYVDMEMQKPEPGELYHTPSWYIAPNKQGKVESIIIESNRYRRFNEDTGKPGEGNAPDQASYFEVWTKHKTSVNYVVYQIYIGNNNTSDFNIESNNYYNINTQIGGDITSIKEDNRVREFSVKHLIQLACKEYYHDGSGTGGGFWLNEKYIDAHYDFRPIVINTDGRSVTVGIYTDRTCKTKAPADAWLQVSPDPNYTLAKQSNSLSNSATINVNVPSKITLYLYNDEYIPKDLSTTQSRTLYVKVATTTLNTPTAIKSVDMFRMDQMPPVNLGFLGGEFDENVGYKDNLVMDRINEGSYKYVVELPPPLKPKYSYYFGYSKVNTTAYGTNDVNHGAAATRALAENKNGYKIDPNNTIAQTNGDLYQYNYYNTYAARFCYDMNRDLNGNGMIDDSELKWYLPTIKQIAGYWASFEDFTGYSSDDDKWSINRLYLLSGFTLDYDTYISLRCVRDVKK